MGPSNRQSDSSAKDDKDPGHASPPRPKGFVAQLLSPVDGSTNNSTSTVVEVYARFRMDGSNDYTDIEKALMVTDMTTGQQVSGAFRYQMKIAQDSTESSYMAITFTPSAALDVGRDYLAEIRPAGAVLPLPDGITQGLKSMFHIGSMPRVRAVLFVPKTTMSKITYVRVHFSEPMDIATMSAAVQVMDEQGKALTLKSGETGKGEKYTAVLSSERETSLMTKVLVAKSAKSITGISLDGTGKASPGADFVLTTVPSSLFFEGGAFVWKP